MKMTGSGLLARTAALTASSMRLESLCFSRYSWTDMAKRSAARGAREARRGGEEDFRRAGDEIAGAEIGARATRDA